MNCPCFIATLVYEELLTGCEGAGVFRDIQTIISRVFSRGVLRNEICWDDGRRLTGSPVVFEKIPRKWRLQEIESRTCCSFSQSKMGFRLVEADGQSFLGVFRRRSGWDDAETWDLILTIYVKGNVYCRRCIGGLSLMFEICFNLLSVAVPGSVDKARA
ncbi:predicted protein [Histoplasma capsulatum var. duboisii H88]|uniref:Predicted protein n=1 Tax=Ajellomyces capsulatus (strain H88) TaxID=544711 RepID=F0UMI2_AJEC8|nr:predicted protein [Histoplasma capsulatum var. duboisii H88]